MKQPSLVALFAALVLILGLAPPAQAAPTVSAASAGTKTVGHATYTWGSVSEPGAREVWTEVRLPSGWSRSQTRTTDAGGAFTIELTYGIHSVGAHEFRVGSRTSSGVVYSSPFTLTRTAWQVGHVDSKHVGEVTNMWTTMPAAARRSVWTEALVGGRWSRSQTRTANGSGYVAIPLTYGAATVGSHTFRVGASTARGTLYSAPFTIQRTRPSVGISVSSAGSKPVNQATNAWGTVRGHAGGQVSTQVWLNGRWSTSQTRRSSSTGYFVIPLTYGAPTPGTYTYRIAAQTPWGTVYSDEFTLRRTPPPTPPTIEQQMLSAVNAARAVTQTCGTERMAPAPALTWNAQLAEAALAHSHDLSTGRVPVGHVGSDGSSLSERVERTGYRWWTIGENVAAGQANVAQAMEGWLDSPGHCVNLMNPNFKEFGGALATNYSTVYGTYWTQIFGSSR